MQYPLIETLFRDSSFSHIIISTGVSSLDEVVEVDSLYNSINCETKPDLVFLHCISQYPITKIQDYNLINISNLKSLTGKSVGYSDHSIGSFAPSIAVAQGAMYIEKHFTVDNSLVGADHAMSADPVVFRQMVDLCRDVKFLWVPYAVIIALILKKKFVFSELMPKINLLCGAGSFGNLLFTLYPDLFVNKRDLWVLDSTQNDSFFPLNKYYFSKLKSLENKISNQARENISFCIAIGNHFGFERTIIYNRLCEMGLTCHKLFNSTARLLSADIHESVIVMPGVTIMPGVIIDKCIIAILLQQLITMWLFLKVAI